MIFGFQGQLPLTHGQLPLRKGSYRYLKRYRYSRALPSLPQASILINSGIPEYSAVNFIVVAKKDHSPSSTQWRD